MIDYHKYSDVEDYSQNISSIEQVVQTILRHHVSVSPKIMDHANRQMTPITLMVLIHVRSLGFNEEEKTQLKIRRN